MMNWLRCPSLPMLIFAALLLGLAPFTSEPHLLQKLRMLMHGELNRTIDIVDLFWHSWPLLWIGLRLFVPASRSCRVSS